ncbi:MAG: hypothetical protein KY468_13290 [Armatimonadetes bacterium]|nr:hypothetical protein [Armatimonadota bacterium]
MDRSTTATPGSKEDAALAEAIKGILHQIECANERMKKDQGEIDRLKAETRAMLDHLKATL